ncbi:pentatricopeptide repeat-containing protein PNM1, mitochondrial [Amborella trichopoda]|uniref:Pentacotripeptide-repeat region of PRORP domain-containing protein n=1 Tax=Amborella trichopoda TaxID=13333 RepID=W1PHM5_AMBTC|nr:pentatricopeptide repeat-containing protein PNM1, mitochondrial [Amborella trichopoda]ERN09502.1 hypothetical protein AMTR_s00029p00120280 [Amborella trichopoda]|eukprot:XP_020525089.1 pentatricopeptide repeat-containing protein PNM1, mitochondrial [Amborella trichopoda]
MVPIARMASLFRSSLRFSTIASHELELPLSWVKASELLHSDSPLEENLGQSNIEPTPELLSHLLNTSPKAGRKVLGFYSYALKHPSSFIPSDETSKSLVDYFGRRKDFKAINLLFSETPPAPTGPKTFASVIDRLVRAGRAKQAVGFFEDMEKLGFSKDKDALIVTVGSLCNHGFAREAEELVKRMADSIFPDQAICHALVKGWCVSEKLDEAKRLVGEIYRGGFELGPTAYNSILECVCKLCRKRDPLRLESETEKVLLEMETSGVARNTETFNVLIKSYCKIRKTQVAMNLFESMSEWGCSPDSETYTLLIRSLYQAARLGEGDEMLEEMKASGFGVNIKTYYGFLKVLCGIERIDHAMKLFEMMKKDGCEPGSMTFDLLIWKLCVHGRAEQADKLCKEAEERGVTIKSAVYEVDPRFVEKKKVKKEKPKRETLPMKMERKRKRLRKLRLSFVKKPKKLMRRAY